MSENEPEQNDKNSNPYICPHCTDFSCQACQDYLVRIWMPAEKVPFALTDAHVSEEGQAVVISPEGVASLAEGQKP